MLIQKTIDTLAGNLLFVPNRSREKMIEDSFSSIVSHNELIVDKWDIVRYRKAVMKTIAEIHVRITVCG